MSREQIEAKIAELETQRDLEAAKVRSPQYLAVTLESPLDITIKLNGIARKIAFLRSQLQGGKA